MKWHIGDVTITQFIEIETYGGKEYILPQATPEALRKLAWLCPHFADEAGRTRMSIHSFLVETPTRRIVVDTGMGNDKPRGRPEWNVPWSRPNCRERLRLAACELARQGSRSRCWPTTRPTFHRRRSQQSEDIDLK
jgi:hypothetical protein